MWDRAPRVCRASTGWCNFLVGGGGGVGLSLRIPEGWCSAGKN